MIRIQPRSVRVRLTLWYVGVMNNEAARPLTIPLDFLGKGRFVATLWADGAKPDEVTKSEREIVSTHRFDLQLAPSGGAALLIRPR